jgi:chromosomal replication initiation ATPase DnaA
MTDPRHTFDTFVVGPANRLASAAARRAAEAPGTNYNPLYLYSASGLGKSHILSAIAQRTEEAHPERTVLYRSAEGFLHDLALALEEGRRKALRERYLKADTLLLDDVQFLTAQPEAQEMLLRMLDDLTARGGQVVLASDRPPAEIDGLDARLLSRFSGGLIVDLAAPDYETRVAIVRRKAESRGVLLTGGVAEAVARVPFANVRELQGALNRVLAVQDLEGRPVRAAEVLELLGVDRPAEGDAVPESAEEERGGSRVGSPSPQARERGRPFPPLPPGPGLPAMEGAVSSLAYRAATRVAESQPQEYNPLFLHAEDPERVRSLLEAVGRTFRELRPDARVGLVSLAEFSEDFIRALSEGVVGAWRDRWGSVDLLLLDGVEGLESAERAEEEVFHLFETLLRRGAAVLLGSDRPPARIPGIDARLRSRFEGGLVVEVGPEKPDPAERPPTPGATERPPTPGAGSGGEPEPTWVPSPEKVVWNWPALEERLAEDATPVEVEANGDRG